MELPVVFPAVRVYTVEKRKGDSIMIRLNENAEIVETVREGLRRTGGYCPCRRDKTEDTKCICTEFRRQMADPDFDGYCHCYLYYKEK